MPGFIPAAPGGSDEQGSSLHDGNIAHFAAVLSSVSGLGESPWLQQLLLWLSEQRPEALVAKGLTVPREIVNNAPDYGVLGGVGFRA